MQAILAGLETKKMDAGLTLETNDPEIQQFVSRMGEKQDWVPFDVKLELDKLMVEFGYESLGSRIVRNHLDDVMEAARAAGMADFR